MDNGLETKLKRIYNTYIASTGKVPRAVQEALTVDIAKNLFGKGAYFAESRTGTGKTLAYLLASAFYIKHVDPKDREKRVTIATPQKHLQQEIMKNFEDLTRAVPELAGITIANIKGRRNYVSTAKVALLDEYLKKACDAIDKGTDPAEDKARHKSELAAAVRETKALIEEHAGDLDLIEDAADNTFLEDRLLPPGETLRDVLALSDEDAPAPAPAGPGAKKVKKSGEEDPSEAYYRAARAKAAIDADIVVTNHTLLLIAGKLARLNKNMEPLVPLKNLVIDEAHSLIKAARNVWHQRVAISHIIDEMMRLSVETEQAGYTGARQDAWRVDGLRRELAKRRDGFRSQVTNNLTVPPGSSKILDIPTIYMRDSNDARYGIREFAKYAMSCIELALNVFQKRRKLTEDQRARMRELKRHMGIVRSFNEVFDTTVSHGGNGYGYYVSFSQVHNEPTVGRIPLYIAWYLSHALWEGVESVSMLSGTIADMNHRRADAVKEAKKDDMYLPGAKFNTIRFLLGLGEKSHFVLDRSMPVTGNVYMPPFPWKNVRVHMYGADIVPSFCKVVNNSPGEEADLDDAEFDAETRAKVKKRIAEAAAPIIDSVLHGYSREERGGSLVLMPAYEDLELLREQLETLFASRRSQGQRNVRNILAQERDGLSLNALVKQYRETASDSILLSVGGWEGVDLPGNLLTHLFIVRVPHASPDDPVFRLAGSSGRKGMFVREQLEEFWRFVQALGRLLRKESDYGEIHILDSRLLRNGDSIHKGYREFIEAEFSGQIEYHNALEAAANE